MSRLITDLHIQGRLSASYFTPPLQSITDAGIASNAAIAATKLMHQHLLSYAQAGGTDVVSATQLLHIAKGAGSLIGLQVRPITAPTGGDKLFTVDIQKAASASGSWTSLLNAPLEISVSESSADNTNYSAVLAGTVTYDSGDALRLVIAASGSTGSQGQGVLCTATVREAAA